MENDYLSQIKQFYLSAFEKLDAKRAVPPIAVEFYDYVGLRHTIRLRNEKVFVRLSDLIKNAPLNVHQALAFILVAKLLKRRIPKQTAEIYRDFARQTEVSQKSQENRRQHGRKIISSAKGRIYDLDEIFTRLNQNYFQNELKKPVLSWSQHKTFRIFGHHDALHETVIISKTLDDVRVPQFVAEFVLYHELLHIKYPTETNNGRRTIHSAAFRRDERKFSRFDEAEKWLEKLATRRRGKKVTRRRY